MPGLKSTIIYPDKALSEIVGGDPLTATELTKAVWDYIKDEDLVEYDNPGEGKRFGGMIINPDENLAKIIGKDEVSPSEMIKRLWKYIKAHDLVEREDKDEDEDEYEDEDEVEVKVRVKEKDNPRSDSKKRKVRKPHWDAIVLGGGLLLLFLFFFRNLSQGVFPFSRPTVQPPPSPPIGPSFEQMYVGP